MPGDQRYQFDLAVVLLRLKRYEEARAIVERLVRSSDAQVTSRAQNLLGELERIDRYEANTAEPDGGNLAPSDEVTAKSQEKEAQVGDRPAVARVATGTESIDSVKAPAGIAKTADSPAPKEAATFNSARSYSMIGTVGTLNCSPAPAMQFVLQAGAIVMRLHAADFGAIEFKGEARNASPGKPSCTQLRGQKARVSYQLSSGQPWDGEISSIELQALP